MFIIKSIQRAIDYIEDHLLDDLKINEIGEVAHMSSSHFQRVFSILTNMTVGEYIRRRRLTKAAQELYQTDTKIIDLAEKFGYSTPESFTKAFQKQHGISPTEVRKGNGNIQSYNRLSIQIQLKGDKPMKYQIIERDAFQIIGVKKTFECDEEHIQTMEINRFWGEVSKDGTIKKLLDMISGQINGLIGATIHFNGEKNEIDYLIGVESNEQNHHQFYRFEVPPSKWAVFEAIGPVIEVVPETWKKIYSEWFPSNDFEHSGAPSLEVYKSPDPTSSSALTEIWVPIK